MLHKFKFILALLLWSSSAFAQGGGGSVLPQGPITPGNCTKFGTSKFFVADAGACATTPTGQALTRTNDTNVTVTLGGSPTNALLNATSLTLGWTGTLGLSRGGTNANLSATGGTSQVLKQINSGAAVTVGQLACSDLSNGATGCSSAAGITALTGDVTATGPGSSAATLATVNTNVGSFGSATQTGTFTVNGKGLITAAANTTITPAIGSITGLGSGVATALGNTAGGAGGFALVGTTPPTGTAGGDLAGTYPNPTLNTSISTAVAFSGLGATRFSSTTRFTGANFSSLSNGDGSVGGDSNNGLILTGKGAVYDVVINNSLGQGVFTIATGSQNLGLAGALNVTGQIQSAGNASWFSSATDTWRFRDGGATKSVFMTVAAAATLQLGAADVSSGAVAQFIRAQSNTGAATTGPDFTFQGTKGTTAGGSLIFQTAATTSYATALTLDNTQTVIAANGIKTNGANYVWETISTSTPSGAASVTFTNLSAYRALRISFFGITFGTNAAAFWLRTSTDNGSTYDAGASAYDYFLGGGTNSPGIGTSGSSTGAAQYLLADGSTTTANASFAGQLTIYDFNKALYASIVHDAVEQYNGTNIVRFFAGGRRKDTTARNAFEVLPSTGTMSGFIVLEGLRG